MESYDWCENKALILVLNDWYLDNDNYCSNCYLEHNENSKITIIKDKFYLSQENPIILIANKFFNYGTCYEKFIYIFFRSKLKQDFLNILDNENSNLDSVFFQHCDDYSHIKQCTENKNKMHKIISRFRNFDKIIEVEHFCIKYITKEQFFIKYV